MKILSLDLGTTMGFAISGEDTAIISGVMDFKVGRYEGGGMRYVRFKKWLTEIKQGIDFDLVVFEEVRRHAGTDAAHVYGGFLAVLTAWCEHHEIPYAGTPVGTIKKFTTGAGNANKQAMIEAVRSWGFEPVDDNEADAIALLSMTRVECEGGEDIH